MPDLGTARDECDVDGRKGPPEMVLPEAKLVEYGSFGGNRGGSGLFGSTIKGEVERW